MTWRGRGLRPILGPATWGRLQWLSRPMGGAGGSSGHSCASVCFKEEDMASRLFIHSCRWRYEEFELRYQHRHFFLVRSYCCRFPMCFVTASSDSDSIVTHSCGLLQTYFILTALSSQLPYVFYFIIAYSVLPFEYLIIFIFTLHQHH